MLAANHPTFLDYVLIASQLPEVDCIIKSGLERNFFLSSMIGTADYLINSRHEELLPLSSQRLQSGECILIFPESTRTVPGQELRLRRGCAQIALRCRCDVRLIRIRCSEPYLVKNMKWYNLPRRRLLIELCAGERIGIEDFIKRQDTQEPSLLARRLTAFLKLKLEAQV